MKYTIEIKVDFGDGDELSKSTEIDEKELDKIKPIIEKIKNFKPYKVIAKNRLSHLPNQKEYEEYTHENNYPAHVLMYDGHNDENEKSHAELYDENWEPDVKYYDRSEAFELFDELVPYDLAACDESAPVRSIESIYLYPSMKKTRLL